MLRLSKTTSLQKLFDYDRITLYVRACRGPVEKERLALAGYCPCPWTPKRSIKPCCSVFDKKYIYYICYAIINHSFKIRSGNVCL